MTKRDTRTRILVATLTLFNEHGEPNTPTNAIADEVDISPGNLHYHFRRKAELVGALMAEFQADSSRLLKPPGSDAASIEDFWAFLQSLLELLAVYRFLFRDTETLVTSYPAVRKALAGFARALLDTMQRYLGALCRDGILEIGPADRAPVARVLVLTALFSERFEDLGAGRHGADESAAHTALAVLGLLKPWGSTRGQAVIDEVQRHYR